MSPLLKKSIPFVFAVLCIQIFIWRRFLFGETGFVGVGDRLSFEIPYYLFIDRWVHKGILPLWDPYIAGGISLLGQAFYSPFYPLQYFLYFFKESNLLLAQNIYLLIHWFLAFFFCFLFSRNYFRSFLATAFTTIIYTFNMSSLIFLGLGNSFISLVYAPLVLLSLHKADKSNMFKYTLLYGIAFAMQLAGSFIQITFYFSIFYLIFFFCSVNRENAKAKITTFLMGTFLGLCLASFQWIPVLVEAKELYRSVIDISLYSSFGLAVPQEAFLRLFDPFVLGRFFSQASSVLTSNQNFYETLPIFSSFTSIVLSLSAITLACLKRRKEVWLWLITCIVVFWTIMGGLPLRLFHILWQEKSLLHSRIAVLIPLALSFLPGLFIEWFKENKFKKQFFTLLGILSLLFVPSWFIYTHFHRAYSLCLWVLITGGLLLFYFLNHQWRAFSLEKLHLFFLAMCLLELVYFSERFINPKTNPEELNAKNDFPVTLPFNALQKKEEILKFLQESQIVGPNIFSYRLSRKKQKIVEYSDNFLPHLYEYPSMNGYQNAFSRDSILYMYYFPELASSNSVYDLRHIDLDRIHPILKQLLRQKFIWGEGQIVDEGFGVFPLYYFADIVVIQPAVTKGMSLRFIWDYIEILNKKEMKILPAIFFTSDENGKNFAAKNPFRNRKIDLDEWNPNTMKFRTQSQEAELLVINEFFHKNWKAYVDGQSSEILKTNFIMRGVKLPPGPHTVLLKYEIPYITILLLVSGLGVVLSLLCLIFHFKERHSRTSKISKHGKFETFA